MGEPAAGPGHGTDVRLRRWFAAEVRRAALDLSAGPPLPAWPSMRRRGIAAPAATMVLVAVVVAVLLSSVAFGPRLRSIGSRPSTPPGTAGYPRSAAASHLSATNPDGLPTSIGDQPVFVGSAIGGHAAAIADDTPFLIGGITEQVIVDCASPNGSPGLPLVGDGCGSGMSLRAPFGWAGPGRDVHLEVSSDLPIVTGAAYVLRVHVHDRQAAQCPAAWRKACEQAIVVDGIAWTSPSAPAPPPTYAGGIPQAIDGQPVLVGDAIATQVAAATNDASFLVGGGVARVALACLLLPEPSSPVSPLLPGCQFDELEPIPPAPGVKVPVIVMPPDLSLADGTPVVLRVHVHDLRAADCPAARRKTCLDALVVEDVVWLGPNFAGDLQVGALTADGLPTSIEGQPVERISAVALARPIRASGCCLVAGWAEGLDPRGPGHLQVADAADASRVWSIDLGSSFEADVRGPVVIDLTGADPLRGTLAWRGGS